MARVPIVATVIGEGGSGGALALAIADHVIMLEHSTYSVASPEGCAAILWSDATKAEEAAARLKLTAARSPAVRHRRRDRPRAARRRAPRSRRGRRRACSTAIDAAVHALAALSPEALLEERYRKYRRLGHGRQACGSSWPEYVKQRRNRSSSFALPVA